MNVQEILFILALVLLNGVFAAYELALASIRPERLNSLAEAKRPGARAALAMKGRMEASLAVVQLGITVVGVLAAAVGGASVQEKVVPHLQQTWHLPRLGAEALALTLFVVPLSALSIMVGELIPKTFGLKHPEWVCLKLSPVMRVFGYLAFPVVWFFELLTKKAMTLTERLIPPTAVDALARINELKAQVSVLRAAKVIGVQQEQIIVQAARLSTLKIREIMLPAQDIVMLHADAPLSENLIIAHLDLHTRFPVAERKGDPQAIIGYATFKEMMFLAKTHPTNPSLREITRPLIRLGDDLSASEALRRMVGEHLHLALVVDAAGAVVGMITQEDLFEEVVGDIQDEFDRLPRQVAASGQQWIAGGGATLTRLREALNRPTLAAGQPGETTANDWIVRNLGRPPKGGDTLKLDGVSILVRKIRRNKITEAVLDPSGQPLGPNVTP